MILLTTAEARVVHAVLEFGPAPVLALLSERDKAHLARAKAKLAEHTMALVEAMMMADPNGGKEPA